MEDPCFSVSGTHVDCTKIVISPLAKEKIDIVVSCINDGFNLGIDVIYSGTVSAAVEGALDKTPAIALSCYGTEELMICRIGERNYNNVYVEMEKTDSHVIYKITGNPDDEVQENTDVDMIK